MTILALRKHESGKGFTSSFFFFLLCVCLCTCLSLLAALRQLLQISLVCQFDLFPWVFASNRVEMICFSSCLPLALTISFKYRLPETLSVEVYDVLNINFQLLDDKDILKTLIGHYVVIVMVPLNTNFKGNWLVIYSF